MQGGGVVHDAQPKMGHHRPNSISASSVENIGNTKRTACAIVVTGRRTGGRSSSVIAAEQKDRTVPKDSVIGAGLGSEDHVLERALGAVSPQSILDEVCATPVSIRRCSLSNHVES